MNKIESFTERVSGDISMMFELPSEQVKELGFSSGDINDIRPGDEIQVGKMITMIMQNVAERINK